MVKKAKPAKKNLDTYFKTDISTIYQFSDIGISDYDFYSGFLACPLEMARCETTIQKQELHQ
jgi:hypothetical protein